MNNIASDKNKFRTRATKDEIVKRQRYAKQKAKRENKTYQQALKEITTKARVKANKSVKNITAFIRFVEFSFIW